MSAIGSCIRDNRSRIEVLEANVDTLSVRLDSLEQQDGELKDCPFCGMNICFVGAEPNVSLSSHRSECVLYGVEFSFTSEAEARVFWDRRAKS